MMLTLDMAEIEYKMTKHNSRRSGLLTRRTKISKVIGRKVELDVKVLDYSYFQVLGSSCPSTYLFIHYVIVILHRSWGWSRNVWGRGFQKPGIVLRGIVLEWILTH